MWFLNQKILIYTETKMRGNFNLFPYVKQIILRAVEDPCVGSVWASQVHLCYIILEVPALATQLSEKALEVVTSPAAYPHRRVTERVQRGAVHHPLRDRNSWSFARLWGKEHSLKHCVRLLIWMNSWKSCSTYAALGGFLVMDPVGLTGSNAS